MRYKEMNLPACLTFLTATCIASYGYSQVGAYSSGTDLFGNYFTQGYASQATAAMYVSPVPVPANVGHTYYTYQPFYPHEMMYRHTDRFHNYYDNTRGLNRTRVHYYSPPVRTAGNYIWKAIQLPRP